MPRQQKGYLLTMAGFTLILIMIVGLSQLLSQLRHPQQIELSTPTALIQEIEVINKNSVKECLDAHLNDTDWTCPQITPDQAALILARLIAQHQTKNLEVNESRKEDIRSRINDTVVKMTHTRCLPENEMELSKDNHHFALESSGFIERCRGGWTISGPWQQVVTSQQARTQPENWDAYYRHLPAEMLP